MISSQETAFELNFLRKFELLIVNSQKGRYLYENSYDSPSIGLIKPKKGVLFIYVVYTYVECLG